MTGRFTKAEIERMEAVAADVASDGWTAVVRAILREAARIERQRARKGK